uniref:Uncharacterized protein n=1 Tax=Candidatus Methanogaster sp. ANME-2c ERB4 TaxID=2759911 RepID=A0A7G9YD70_9EURY|nr:hypothetical protein DMJHIOCL_00033 [Methanosarcinales archaeon ANME-2c ERB4]
MVSRIYNSMQDVNAAINNALCVFALNWERKNEKM